MTDEFETLYQRYVADLSAALDVAFERWRMLALSEKYNDRGMIYDRVWPAGMGGDPVVLKVVRDYFVAAGILIERRLEAEQQTGTGAGAFGVDDGDDEDDEPSTPGEFLFGMLSERHDALSRKIALLKFMPIGFEDNSRITEEAQNDGVD